jgi:O-antigen/teichoic acid export membrane protein
MIVVLIAFSKAIEALADIFHGIYQKNEKMEYTAIANIIKGIFSILFLFVGIYFFHSLLIGIILYTLSWGMIFVFYELRISKRFEKIKVSFNRDSIFKLAREGLPMGIISGLGSLRANIPRYFIALDFGLREVGIFSALSYIMIVGSLLIMALTTSLLPRFAKYYSDKSCTNFFALAKKALVVSISLGILGIIISLVIGKQVLVILYSAEYAEYSTVFVLIAIASAITFSTSMLTAMITSARLFSSQLPVSFIELVSIVLFSLYFVPKLGMYGAGLALIMSSAVHLICKSLMLASVLKKMKNPIN